MDYIISFENGFSGYLSHHGIKGMHWGEWNEETRRRRMGISEKAFKDERDALMRGEKYSRSQRKAFEKREKTKNKLDDALQENRGKNKSMSEIRKIADLSRKAKKAEIAYEEKREWNNPGKSNLSREQFNSFATRKTYGALGKWAAGPMAGLYTIPIAAVAGGPVAAVGAAAVHGVLGGSAVRDLYKVNQMNAQRTPVVGVEKAKKNLGKDMNTHIKNTSKILGKEPKYEYDSMGRIKSVKW